MVNSRAAIAMRRPAHVLDVICRHFAEEDVPTRWTQDRGEASFPFGEGQLRAATDRLLLDATAADLDSLARLKNLLAAHVEELAPEERPDIVWTGDGCDAAVLPNLRVMQVVRSAAPTPRVRRVTLRGERLERFATGGLHVKLLIPPPGVAVPEWPTPGRNGRPLWPREDRRPAMRTYTIRQLDVAAGEMTIDFVLHGDEGVASRWAAHAAPGDVVGVMGPGGAAVREAEWYLLAGDMTALPVIARVMEGLPPTARGLALIEVPGPEEEQRIAGPAGMALHYVHTAGHGPGALEQAVRAVVLGAGLRPFVFVGAEASVARRLRRHMREDRGLDRTQHLCAAYWRSGHAEGEGPEDE